MADQRNSTRPFLSERDAQFVEQARMTVNETLELLDQLKPDTFLGRKTQEPFQTFPIGESD
jgi:hypothetical protein